MKFGHFLLLLPLLAACDRNPDSPTAEESRQLDDAANLLDRAPQNLEAIDDSALNTADDGSPRNEL